MSLTGVAIERAKGCAAFEGTGSGRPPGSLALAETLERWLGDPEVASNSVSFARALEYDELDALPSAGLDRLRGFGTHRYFVPERLGGALRSTEDLLTIARAVARRDMNVAVSESTQLWMMLAWIAGDASQQADCAEAMLRGGVIPCLAYSESLHGADLAANEFLATPHQGGYILHGEKFPINRGRTSTHVVLLGITEDEQTPAWRRQSLFLVDRSRISPQQVSGIPRVPTYGLRGCDISGIAFDGAWIDASARLGSSGGGLELALRGLLLTRAFCSGLSLGTGDTMLRTVAGFLSRRMLYGGPASEIPYVSESLANAYVSLLVAECEALVAMRGLHLHTGQFSLWGNLTKVQVARLVDGNAAVLARTLGARCYMRAPEHLGIFQKMLRDNAIVSVFDGSEPVCLDSIAVQLPAMAKAHRQARADDWSQLYDLRRDLPGFEPSKVSISGRGRDAVFASLPTLVRMLDEVLPAEHCNAARLAALRAHAARMRQEVGSLFERLDHARARPVTQAVQRPGKATPTRLLRLAEQACGLHAKLSALGIWLHNRDHLGGFFADGEWLEVALARPRVDRHEVGDLEPATAGRLFARMMEQLTAHEYFSIQSMRQAAPGTHEESHLLLPEDASPRAVRVRR
jgi:alkylation response protein AidB-like acyl-CoA dehydrogenase